MSGPRYSIIPGDAVYDTRLSEIMMRVLTVLGTHTDRQGWCIVKQKKMADGLHVSRESVNRSIKKLVEFGYLEKERRLRQDGGVSISRYRVIMDREDRGDADPADENENLSYGKYCEQDAISADGENAISYQNSAENHDPPVTPTSHTPVIPEDHSPCDPKESQLNNDPSLQRPKCSSAQERARTAPPDFEKLEAKLLEAGGDALNAASPGLSVMAVPMTWLERGADLDRDIVPAIRARAKTLRPGSVRSWAFFDGVIDDWLRAKAGGKSQSDGDGGRLDPAKFSDADWRKRLDYFSNTGTWSENWGPEPGKPRCLVPADLLAQRKAKVA